MELENRSNNLSNNQTVIKSRIKLSRGREKTINKLIDVYKEEMEVNEVNTTDLIYFTRGLSEFLRQYVSINTK